MLGKGKANGLQSLEKDLIAAAKEGSVGAFEQLIHQVEKKMLSVAAGLATSPEEAEDIYQEAMINAFKALPKFRLESQFSTWLYRIVVNTAISYRRKVKNKLASLISHDKSVYDDNQDSLSNEKFGVNHNPEAQLVNEQLSIAIEQAMRKLSDKERVAFVLCHQQEFKICDAAEVMSSSQGTVKSYLFRAREKMRTELHAFMR